MNKTIVDGFKKVENYLGYWPSFHDDIIKKIEISSKEIIFYIELKSYPNEMSSYPEVKLTFLGVDKFSLEGEPYGCASIIFDIESETIDDYIETQISSSLGASGHIRSNKIQIEFV